MRHTTIVLVFVALLTVATRASRSADPAPVPPSSGPTNVVSLDGNDWLLAPDPQNIGREQAWPQTPQPEAKRTQVPWIIQDAFPGYHGLAWYWREFSAPTNPHPQGCYLLRFWGVDYKAEVWLNGVPVGQHEGGESPFVLDVTKALQPNQTNRLAVRVLNPTHQPIDGIVLNETPHRNKALPYSAGNAWNQGGIIDSVELLLAPAVRVADLFVRPDGKTGDVRIQATIHNASKNAVAGHLELAIAPATAGETQVVGRVDRELPPGETVIESRLRVDNPRLWELNDPFLYRVTASVRAAGSISVDEHSVRCGFRDFRFERGAFRLNGRRIYLRCSHTGNCCPIGLELPHDPDFLRRDLINAKAMRFNAIRFIAGVPKRYQLDLCDELGLMVYEESYAGWCLGDSPQMPARYDESVLGMVRRDRNHPSVTIWGLLNETPDGPVFRHAASVLPALRALDDSRLVLLNSGRWDSQSGGVAGIELWRNTNRTDPCVTFNGTDHKIQALGITWAPRQLAFHPGRNGEYAVVRWKARADEQIDFSAVFTSIAERATTDVHVLHNGQPLFDGGINVLGGGREQKFQATLAVRAGDTLDCVCGYGNGNYGADTTALAVTVKCASGKQSDAAADFSSQQNPNGPWSHGHLQPGEKPVADTFRAFPAGQVEQSFGTLSNPGSNVWEDVLADKHPYQRVPHTADVIRTLRTIDGGGQPLFLSEYGIGSSNDLLRLVRHYEQAGKPDVEDAAFYRAQRDRFLADWERWKLAEAFDRPEDFFAQSNARMGGQRLLGLNAIRSNPQVIGHSLTGTVDQGMTAEGLWTTFRELKPGTMDAVFDGWAPLRWCLFAEPVHVYRKSPVRLEAVLANEDALPPGEYPVRLQVVGPNVTRVFERTLTVSIPARTRGARLPDGTSPAEPSGPTQAGSSPDESPMVLPVFDEEVVIDGPAGKYRLLATFERGAAAAGETVEFYVDDPALMPPVETEVVLWGTDAGLSQWLTEHSLRVRPFAAEAPGKREVILAAATPPAPGGAAAFRVLADRIARGSTVIFLSPAVFAEGDNRTAWLPLAAKGSITGLPAWLYHKEDWAKPHPIFAGLPAGCLLDYTYYRELIPDAAFVGQDPPAEAVAGAINATIGYSSGLTVAVYPLGAGRFVLNTLHIREHLGRQPVAERLLRNLLRYAGQDAQQPLAELPPEFAAHLKALGYD
ncbi:MAG: glycoside hydrolase family 2 [Planctomycetota bacterium]|nr:glycoside hydrolase family 2 [Planctomycetota bacterium]